MDWFLYDNGLRHERVNAVIVPLLETIFFFCLGFLSLPFTNQRTAREWGISLPRQ